MNIGEKFYCSRCMREVNDEAIKCPHCGYDPFDKNKGWVLEEGTLLQNGRYQLGAVLGSGGFGITYAAWDLLLNYPLAIKEYYPRNLCERDVSEDDSVIINPGREGMYQSGLFRFIREARILGTLQNFKNVVPVSEWFEANNTAYIVMKYISGVTLEDYVKANHIPPQKLITMMRDIVEALVLVHAQGIIHRDISPTNIMVQDDGTMILIDFGASSTKERMSNGEDHTVIYNRKYAPIEQYDEAGMQGSFTDVYALSATLYHLICGTPPKESVARKFGDTLQSPRDRNIPIKKYQDRAIMDGLILQPEKRTPSMAVFRSMLYNLPMPEEVTRRRRFIFRVLSAVAVVTLAVILVAINFTTGFPLREGLLFSLHSDGFHVSGFTSLKEKVSVPPSIAGIDIVQIDEAAFQGNEVLTYAEIPGTVKNIGRFAFNMCTNLKEAILGEGVSSISSQAFSGCTNLQAVMTTSTLTEIDPEAFSNTGERLILLGNLDTKAAKIAGQLGLNYAHIESIENSDGITITKYETAQNKAVVPDVLNGKPIKVIESGNIRAVFPTMLQSVILPRSLDKIGDYALRGVSIAGIDLPSSLKHIGREGFSQSFVESIDIPDSVQFVGEEAFSICMYIHSVKLSSSMKEIPRECFVRCGSLNSVTIPEGITAINDRAFQRCSNLTFLAVPDTVSFIGDSAFTDCFSLDSIYLPPTLDHMDISALDGCRASMTITGYEGSLGQYIARKYGYNFYDLGNSDEHIIISPNSNLWVKAGIASSDTIALPSYSVYSKAIPARQIDRARALKSSRVILPKHVQAICAGSFMGNLAVVSIDCPSSLRRIETVAFRGCENLRAINLSDGLEAIDTQAFQNCRKLTEIILPSSVKSIGENAFENCVSLTAIKIPTSLAVLDRKAFRATGLVSLDIPGNIVKCSSAFEDCKNLRSVAFAEGIRTIEGSFAGCTELETVTIPDGVNKLSRSTFNGCGSLRDVWIYSDKIDLDYISDNTKKKGYLFADSPNLTIHARKASSSHVYASLHNINFDAIPDRDEVADKDIVRFKASKRIYSDAQLISMLTPKPNDNKYHYWGQFQYALGYGLTELAHRCLDVYERSGNDDDKIWANSARMFISQIEKHGYYAGEAIAFFEGRKDHPAFKVGDIIVEINGQAFRTEAEYNKLEHPSKIGFKVYTVLRADDDGMLRKIDLMVRKGSPLCAVMNIIPLMFEEL